jgi:hypothetical protein
MSRRWPFLLLLVILTILFAWEVYKREVGHEYGLPVSREDRPCLYYLFIGMQLIALLTGWGLLLFAAW